MLQKTEEHFVQNSLAKILFKYKMLQKKGADFVHNSLVFNAKIFNEIQKFCKNVGGGVFIQRSKKYHWSFKFIASF